VLENPEKVYQYVFNRRLVVFSDVKPTGGGDQYGGRDWSTLFALVSNARVTARKLRSNEVINAQHYVRCVLCGVEMASLGKDSLQGLMERTRFMRTLPRRGDPDPTLKEAVVGTTPQHAALRGRVIGWALTMPRDEALAELNSPEFKEQRQELQAYTDPVSLFVDQCLEPWDGPVPKGAKQDLLQAFQAWCEVTNSTMAQRAYTEDRLVSQIRRLLSSTHRPRRSFTREECEQSGKDYAKRPKAPAADWGYRLRPGLFRHGHYEPAGMDNSKRMEGGIEAVLTADFMPGVLDLVEYIREQVQERSKPFLDNPLHSVRKVDLEQALITEDQDELMVFLCAIITAEELKAESERKQEERRQRDAERAAKDPSDILYQGQQ
jgi:hypothetical protein